MGKALLWPGSQKYDLQINFSQNQKIRFRKGIEPGDIPRQQALGQHDQVFFVAYVVHQHVALAVAGERIEAGQGGRVELHC
jgi:hypothetical protein